MKSHKRTNTRPGEQSQTKQFRKKKNRTPLQKPSKMRLNNNGSLYIYL